MNRQTIEKHIAFMEEQTLTMTERDLCKISRWLLDELKKREWVPVSERLPEGDYLEVWAVVKAAHGTLVTHGEWEDGKWQVGWRAELVTHWMPYYEPELPEPPPEATV